MALWDELARVHNLPLVRLLGGVEKSVRAYGAIGYDGVQGCAKAAEDWATQGFTGIKAKIGYPTVQEDVAVVRAMRKAAGDEMAIMVDYNQCLTPAKAVERLRVLGSEGLTWVEEPTLAHDYAGHVLIAREARTPIQCGENWWGPDLCLVRPHGVRTSGLSSNQPLQQTLCPQVLCFETGAQRATEILWKGLLE